MNDNEKKYKPKLEVVNQSWGSPETSSRPISSPHGAGKVRSIHPLGMRVLVQIVKEADLSPGGLYLPEGSKQSMQESLLAKVIEVAMASDADTDEEHNVSGIPQGALVLIPKDAGTKIPWDETLRVVETKEVLATVSEVGMI